MKCTRKFIFQLSLDCFVSILLRCFLLFKYKSTVVFQKYNSYVDLTNGKIRIVVNTFVA